MKKYIIGLLILVSCLFAFKFVTKPNIISEDTALKSKIIESVESSKEIDFSKITNFDWDVIYIFTPYSAPKDILSKDGIKTSNSTFKIEVDDSINMIGFVKGDKLVNFVELTRNYDGVNLTQLVKYKKSEAKFNISQDKKNIIFQKN